MNEKQTFQDDEIDLLALWDDLLAEKRIVVLAFLSVLTIGLIYAFLKTPTYQSSVYFLPPGKDAIQELNRLDMQLKRDLSYKPEIVQNAFLKNLNSRSLLQQVFEENMMILGIDEEFESMSDIDRQKEFDKKFGDFLDSFNVKHPKNRSISNSVSASLGVEVTSEQVKTLLSEIVQKAVEKTKLDLVKEVTFERQTIIDQTTKEIQSARLIAKEQRLDRIAQLSEAIKIARNLKMPEPKDISSLAVSDSRRLEGSPLYYLGYRFLEAEKDVLLDRESDDPFIRKLRSLQERLSLLGGVYIDKDNIQVIRIDEAPTLGEKIKPKKALIFAVAVMLGVMLGVFIAFFKRMLARRKLSLKNS